MAKIHEQITEASWCQHWEALDSEGNPTISIHGDKACAWCATAWLKRIYGGRLRARHVWRLAAILGLLPLDTTEDRMASISRWNDHPNRTFDEVKRAFKLADL